METGAVKRKVGIILTALIKGLVLGVVARAWMRWISTDPEFSWSGSIFIVLAFMIFMVNHSIVRLLRQRFKGRRSVFFIRTSGVIFSLPIFTAAGGIMFPAVALASVATWNTALGKRTRGVLFLLALIIPIRISMDIISDFGWSFATIGRILLFVSIYTVVIFSTKPTLSPFRNEASEVVKMSRGKKILLVVGILLIGGIFFIFTVGLSGG
jgi:membrane protein YdbS with pleckstrin-like domain